MIENFIYQSYLSDISICDKLIEFHKNSNDKKSGAVLNNLGKITQSNEKIKKSTDVCIKPTEIDELTKNYFDLLKEVLNQYVDKFKMSGKSNFTITESFNIQHYLPNEGFYVWHCERGLAAYPICTRHLVFMTYLNDVNDGGETEFYYQKLKIKPRKGLTLIWPADWTYTHRGIPSLTEEKYIVTGWFSFLDL
jgi:prolyl 4-hydroxylase